MASDTNKVKADKARAAGTLFETIEQAAAANRVPQLAELLTKIADNVGLEEIAKTISNAIADGTPAQKQKFALEYANLLRQFQQLVGEVTRDEVTMMATQQIHAMLRDEFNIVHNSLQTDESGTAEKTTEGETEGAGAA